MLIMLVTSEYTKNVRIKRIVLDLHDVIADSGKVVVYEYDDT